MQQLHSGRQLRLVLLIEQVPIHREPWQWPRWCSVRDGKRPWGVGICFKRLSEGRVQFLLQLCGMRCRPWVWVVPLRQQPRGTVLGDHRIHQHPQPGRRCVRDNSCRRGMDEPGVALPQHSAESVPQLHVVLGHGEQCQSAWLVSGERAMPLPGPQWRGWRRYVPYRRLVRSVAKRQLANKRQQSAVRRGLQQSGRLQQLHNAATVWLVQCHESVLVQR